MFSLSALFFPLCSSSWFVSFCTATIFSHYFCRIFSNLSPSHPQPMLLWRTLNHRRAQQCCIVLLHIQSNQGHSTGYINTTATLRCSHRDETHMNFSEEFQCSERAQILHRCLMSEFIASILFSSVGEN